MVSFQELSSEKKKKARLNKSLRVRSLPGLHIHVYTRGRDSEITHEKELFYISKIIFL